MKLRLGRKQRFSLEEIEREAAAEIEKRVSMGKPPPEEWKGLAERAGADTPMPNRPTSFTPPAPPAPPRGEAELDSPGEPAAAAEVTPRAAAKRTPSTPTAKAAAKVRAPAAAAKAQPARAKAAKAPAKAAKAPGRPKAPSKARKASR